MSAHDTLIWTWHSPTGQQFRGTPDYIEGVKTGWDAGRNGVAPELGKLTLAAYEAGHAQGVKHGTCKYSETCGRAR